MKTDTLLYDRLLTNPHIDTSLKQHLQECMIVDATNVSDYYFQSSDQEIWSLATDFPNVAPPFQKFYLEYRAPHEMTSRETGITPWPKELPIRWGILCVSSEMTDLFPRLDTQEEQDTFLQSTQKKLDTLHKTLNPEIIQKANRAWAMDDSEACRELLKTDKNVGMYFQVLQLLHFIHADQWDEVKEFLGKESKFRWRMECVLFAQFRMGHMQQSLGPFFGWDMLVLPDGRFQVEKNGDVQVMYSAMGAIQTNVESLIQNDRNAGMQLFHDTRETFGKFLHTGLLAISFMHCKNVALSQVTPPRIQPTQKQRRWKLIPPQPVTYHVLDIEPMKQVLRAEGHAEKTGIQRSLHICRGHFAHYDEAHKLFGKYAGTFWKPQHVRGSGKQGVTLKDYRIKKLPA